MRLNRLIAALAVALTFAATSQAATKGTRAISSKKTQQQDSTVRGVILEVRPNANKESGEITIKVSPKQVARKQSKSAAAAAAPKKPATTERVVTVVVNQATKYQKVVHSQGNVVRDKATFLDVQKAGHVRVHMTGKKQAREVELVIRQNKKVPTKKAKKA